MKFNYLLKHKGVYSLFALLAIFSVVCTMKNTLTNSNKNLNSATVKTDSKNKLDYLSYMNQKKEAEKKSEEKIESGSSFKFKSTSGIKSKNNEGKEWKYPIEEKQILEDWWAISSYEFENIKRFPPVKLPNGTVDYIAYNALNFRLNKAYNCTDADNKPADERYFWFRLKEKSLYYSSTPADINVLGFITVEDIFDVNKNNDISGVKEMYCFNTKDEQFKEWRLCHEDEETRNKWFCTLKNYLGGDDPICWGVQKKPGVHYTEKTIKQPIVMVPLPSPTCNERWDYQQNGDDWECDCKEGKEQSPINLPKKYMSLSSPVKPIFQYKEVDFINSETTLDGLLEASQKLKIRNNNNMINIWHEDMGKVTTIDGTIYKAQQITFHTPANHKIADKEYPLEVSVIHYGVTKGDIGKQLTVNFLFEAVPGVYNDLFEDLDLFSLPDPTQKSRDLNKPLYIPKILWESGATDPGSDIPFMKPFSFYTYQGSLAFPPCTERTITIVNSKPIRVSQTSITLLKEALKMPDLKSKTGEIFQSDNQPVSNRSIQELNGRPVFHYDHESYCGPEPAKKKPKKSGHYEKVVNTGTQYFFVNGQDPSGLPGAFVVSEKEAKGLKFDEV